MATFSLADKDSRVPGARGPRPAPGSRTATTDPTPRVAPARRRPATRRRPPEKGNARRVGDEGQKRPSAYKPRGRTGGKASAAPDADGRGWRHRRASGERRRRKRNPGGQIIEAGRGPRASSSRSTTAFPFHPRSAPRAVPRRADGGCEANWEAVARRLAVR